MGDVSRMDRGSRFVDEFNDDVVKNCDLKVGDKLTIKSICLGGVGCGEGIALWATLTDERGVDHELRLDGGIFDPDDGSENNFLVERVAGCLGLDDSEESLNATRKRMESVDL